MRYTKKDVHRIIKKHAYDKPHLSAILDDLQSEYGWLPPQVLKTVAEQMDCRLADIYVHAASNKNYRLTPPGRHVVKVCHGASCHAHGASAVLHEVQDRLEIDAGKTSKDKQYSLETTDCCGTCALSPIILIDGKGYYRVNVHKIDTLLARYSTKILVKKRSPKKGSRKKQRSAKKVGKKKRANRTKRGATRKKRMKPKKLRKIVRKSIKVKHKKQRFTTVKKLTKKRRKRMQVKSTGKKMSRKKRRQK